MATNASSRFLAPQGTPVTEVVDAFRNDLRIYDELPSHLDVIKVRDRDACPLLRAGEVAVYDPSDQMRCEGLVDGGIYVIEYQFPVGGMSWETFHRHGADRVRVDRHLIRARRSARDPGLWCAQPLRQRFAGAFQCSDPDQPENLLHSKLAGRVVGLFRPNMEY
jgi:hypothetical protein